ncbi:hypothetical protein FHW69_002823 [Luteibacter sp. Sphag1AF]|uniref:hypothetical protein n=1 Tax=Luteibacter sp. Sphag1AF TaxID=2587031 RepID=UPI00160EBF1C|nr:hypothetical protein [Luteibacter sp. Sphag1AF]MBB3228188.1 hypothetical protein [Luteibacter sp. Sphag1AF]
MSLPMVMMCLSENIDQTTGACSQIMWVHIPSLIPEFDTASGVAVGVAVLSVWAIAYGFKKMKRVGD